MRWPSNNASARKAQDQMVPLLNSTWFREELMSILLKLFQQKYKSQHFLTCCVKLGLLWKQKYEGRHDKKTAEGFSGGSVVRNLLVHTGDLDSVPGSGRSPGAGNDDPLQYSCLGNSRQRSLAGYSPWSHKELDTTEWLNNRPYKHKRRNPPQKTESRSMGKGFHVMTKWDLSQGCKHGSTWENQQLWYLWGFLV